MSRITKTIATLALAAACTTFGLGASARAGASDRPAGKGLASLPALAEGPVSAALGAHDAAYAVSGWTAHNGAQGWTAHNGAQGWTAHNAAQGLSARFGPSGVVIAGAGSPVEISLEAVGRAGALRAVRSDQFAMTEHANTVDSRSGDLEQWWANGPLGLEQGFDLGSRPAGTGDVVLALGVSGLAAGSVHSGTVGLRGGLEYTGLHVTDGRGRSVPARFVEQAGRLDIRVDDRGATYPLRVDPFVRRATLYASDTEDGDDFGYSVAMSGNTLAVGAPNETVGSCGGCGAVYVFVKGVAVSWADPVSEDYLTPTGGVYEDDQGLGTSVAIDSSLIVAGAPHYGGGASLNEGAVYLFYEPSGGWSGDQSPSQMLTNGVEESNLGTSVAVSVPAGITVSSPTVVAGAPASSDPGASGSIDVFTEEPAIDGDIWEYATLTMTDPSGSDLLGSSVSLSGDSIAAGAPGHTVNGVANEGAVYIFNQPSTGWGESTVNQSAELTASDGAGELGYSVALSGDSLVAGAPNTTEGGNAFQGALYQWGYRFGFGGRFYWIENPAVLTIGPNDGAGETTQLGATVALEGNTIISGAGNTAYAFVPPANGWPSGVDDDTAVIATNAPAPTAVAIDGDIVAVGAPEFLTSKVAAHVMIFTRDDPKVALVVPKATNYREGTIVDASYTCTAATGATLISCAGTVADGSPVPTTTVGSQAFTVTAEDNDGATTTRTVYYTVLPPSVTAVSPSSGKAAGGNTVKITGTGFSPGATVDFGSVPSPSVTWVSGAVLKAVVPAGTAGTVDVTVTTPDGTVTSEIVTADEYTYTG